jgi:hypothetical protein
MILSHLLRKPVRALSLRNGSIGSILSQNRKKQNDFLIKISYSSSAESSISASSHHVRSLKEMSNSKSSSETEELMISLPARIHSYVSPNERTRLEERQRELEETEYMLAKKEQDQIRKDLVTLKRGTHQKIIHPVLVKWYDPFKVALDAEIEQIAFGLTPSNEVERTVCHTSSALPLTY